MLNWRITGALAISEPVELLPYGIENPQRLYFAQIDVGTPDGGSDRRSQPVKRGRRIRIASSLEAQAVYFRQYICNLDEGRLVRLEDSGHLLDTIPRRDGQRLQFTGTATQLILEEHELLTYRQE